MWHVPRSSTGDQVNWPLPPLHKILDPPLAPVVQRVDSVIHWISCYPEDEICRKTRYSHMKFTQNKGKSVWIIVLCRNHAKSIKRNTEWLCWIVTYPVNKLSSFWTTEPWCLLYLGVVKIVKRHHVPNYYERYTKGVPFLSKMVYKRVRVWTSGRSLPV